MKIKWTRLLWSLFAIGLLSPILALCIKPADYAFYMFYPATPLTTIGRVQLVAGDIVLVVGFMITLVSAIGLAVLEKGLRRARAFSCFLLIAANPLQQPIFLENLDTYMNYRLRDRAENNQIVGKSHEDVQRIFGIPTSKAVHTWEYQPLPIYWIGSRFQVFFENGVVCGFEGNDD